MLQAHLIVELVFQPKKYNGRYFNEVSQNEKDNFMHRSKCYQSSKYGHFKKFLNDKKLIKGYKACKNRSTDNRSTKVDCKSANVLVTMPVVTQIDLMQPLT